MPLLQLIARAFFIKRLFGQGRHSSRRGLGYGRRAPRRHRSSGLGRFGPFPTYSRRTRGGSRVTVGGCCLPIPLALTAGSLLGLRRLIGRR